MKSQFGSFLWNFVLHKCMQGNGKVNMNSISFTSAARRMDALLTRATMDGSMGVNNLHFLLVLITPVCNIQWFTYVNRELGVLN
ncbi:hypothetical protein LINPERPRIM_LOCUS25369 [Linum perenne]